MRKNTAFALLGAAAVVAVVSQSSLASPQTGQGTMNRSGMGMQMGMMRGSIAADDTMLYVLNGDRILRVDKNSGKVMGSMQLSRNATQSGWNTGNEGWGDWPGTGMGGVGTTGTTTGTTTGATTGTTTSTTSG